MKLDEYLKQNNLITIDTLEGRLQHAYAREQNFTGNEHYCGFCRYWVNEDENKYGNGYRKCSLYSRSLGFDCDKGKSCFEFDRVP